MPHTQTPHYCTHTHNHIHKKEKGIEGREGEKEKGKEREKKVGPRSGAIGPQRMYLVPIVHLASPRPSPLPDTLFCVPGPAFPTLASQLTSFLSASGMILPKRAPKWQNNFALSPTVA